MNKSKKILGKSRFNKVVNSLDSETSLNQEEIKVLLNHVGEIANKKLALDVFHKCSRNIYTEIASNKDSVEVDFKNVYKKIKSNDDFVQRQIQNGLNSLSDQEKLLRKKIDNYEITMFIVGGLAVLSLGMQLIDIFR